MALSGLDIYKLLPKTNCRECGFATCLAFAMQLAKKTTSIDKCPYVSQEAKSTLEASSQPPIKLVSIGEGQNKFESGNETVMFRHEEKFHHPCGIGFIIEDNIEDPLIEESIEKINKLKFERVGQKLEVNLVAVRQNGGGKRFSEVIKLVAAKTSLAIVLMSNDSDAVKESLPFIEKRNPLIYSINRNNIQKMLGAIKGHQVSVVASAGDLDSLSSLVKEITTAGVVGIFLDTEKKAIREKVWDLTQIRRQALKRNNRILGYPSLVVIENNDPYEEAIEAATYISKYAGIVLIKGLFSWEALSLLTLRQNIYTDPQKPLQIEPKLYPIGKVTEKSPVLITTNFSLSYYTVLGEVEASKIPSYIMSVDTEGMSVLTAWAAEKFNPDKINESLNKFGVKESVSHKQLIIPGYVAVMSGELEEKSGWQVVVGPKEAAGIPSFLKNM